MATSLRDPLPNTTFLKGVFAIIVSMVVVVVVMLFALRINEVVHIDQGELVAGAPRVVYRAPYDVGVARVLVREGDAVRPSDTLLVLENPDVTSRYVSVQEAYEASLANLELLLGLIDNAQRRIANLQLQLENQAQVHRVNKALHHDELKALAEQLHIVRRQMYIAHRAFTRDSLLHTKGLLSKMDYERSYSARLNGVREEQTLRSEHESRSKQYERLDLDAAAAAKSIKEEMLNVQAELLQLRQREVELEAIVQQQRSELEAYRQAFEKQFVVAEALGTVRFLYNTKASADLITKGEVLVEMVPVEDSVYAHLQLRQDQVKEVAVGQRVHLKLDAYYYYKYGIVEGRVRYVSSPDDQNNFYVIVDVERPKIGLELKPGYRVSAEIIQGRVTLFEFILKRIFYQAEPVRQKALPNHGRPVASTVPGTNSL